MLPLKRKSDPFALIVGMTGVKLGDRFVQIGCEDGGPLAAIASKVGLSGRAAAIVPDADAAARATKGAAKAGVLVEVEVAPLTRLPLEDDSFDLAVIDDTGGLLGGMDATTRGAVIREVLRVLRAGGRLMVIGSLPREGLSAFFSRGSVAHPFDPLPSLEADGFKLARLLAEREGLRFVEAVKPRSAGTPASA